MENKNMRKLNVTVQCVAVYNSSIMVPRELTFEEAIKFAPEFEMIIPVPTDRDDEEYIDELLDGILNDEFRYNIEWDFVDGLS